MSVPLDLKGGVERLPGSVRVPAGELHGQGHANEQAERNSNRR
jgi:hypothetical protein